MLRILNYMQGFNAAQVNPNVWKSVKTFFAITLYVNTICHYLQSHFFTTLQEPIKQKAVFPLKLCIRYKIDARLL